MPRFPKSTVAALLRLSAMEAGDWSTALEQILRVDAETLGVSSVSYWAAQDDPPTFFCELGYHADVDAFEREIVLEERYSPAYFQAVRELQLIDVEDVERDPRTVELRPYLTERRVRALLDVPIWLHGKSVGVLCHEHVDEPRAWTRCDREFVLAIGQVIVAALQSRERTRAEAAEQQAMFLKSASAQLSSTLNLAEAEDVAVRRALPRLGDAALLDVIYGGRLRRSAIAAVEPWREQQLRHAMRRYPLHAPHLSSIALRLQSSVLVPVVAKSLTQGDIDEDYGRHLVELGVRSAMAVPLHLSDRQTGALVFLSMGSTFEQSDLRLAESYARMVTSSLENARLFRRAQDAIGIRDEFISLASHELRTPLTSLRAAAEAIASGMHEQHDLERLGGVLVRQVDRLDRLAQRMLDAVQINSGTLTIHRAPADLSGIVREVASELHDELARAGCRLDLNLDRSVVGSWDARRLELVVVNLLENAMKFGKGEPIEVTLERGPAAATLEVRDHGAGLRPGAEDDADVFLQYERAAPTGEHGGLGLGLFIVRHIVHAHGGTVDARSHEDGGASVIVELPYDAPGRAQEAEDGEATRAHH